jgi:uncharacterized protein YkwD
MLQRTGLLLAFVLLVAADSAEEQVATRTSALQQMEREVRSRINEVRKEHGLLPLQPDPALRRVARAHSADMGERDYFGHVDPDGVGPFERIEEAGINYTAAAENVAWNNYPKTMKRVVKGWMNSPTHRKNILSPKYTHTGVGVARRGEKSYFYAQLFAAYEFGASSATESYAPAEK